LESSTSLASLSTTVANRPGWSALQESASVRCAWPMRCLVAGWGRPERESGPPAKPDAEDKTEQRALFKGHEMPPATLTWMGEPSEPEDKVLALDKIRRHIRILVDIGRLAGVATDLDRFLDQVVLQVARAVEIDHVKVLFSLPTKGDFLVC